MTNKEPIYAQLQISVSATISFVLKSLMPIEIPAFCLDNSDFQDAFFCLPSACSHLETVTELVVYCKSRMLLPELISAVRRRNPRRYEEHKLQLFNGSREQLALFEAYYNDNRNNETRV